MPRKSPYALYVCYDCDFEFVIPRGKRNPFCPDCGDNIGTKFERHLWLDSGFSRKRPWTEEEDRALIYGRERGTPFREIAAVLPGRTYKACANRHSQLKRLKGRLTHV